MTVSRPQLPAGHRAAGSITFGYQLTGNPTGDPSSSCEMIFLRINSHGGNIRVCMGIFTTALRNKKILQILNKKTSTYFHSVSLVISVTAYFGVKNPF